MIDPREIRAGNWVIKITGKDNNAKSFFEYKAITIDEYYYTFARVCFPIKITAEILGKCAFKHEFGDWYINRPAEGIDGGMPFLRYRHQDNCWYLDKIKLWSQPVYLHQLQNLFYALSNEELNVQLERFENIAVIGPVKLFVNIIQGDEDQGLHLNKRNM
jgi:hypothetical protein